MQFKKQVKRLGRWVPIIFASACVGQVDGTFEDPVEVVEEELVAFTGNPPTRTTVSGAIPQLFSGRTDSTLGIHNLPTELNRVPQSNTSTWLSSVTGRTDASASVYNSRLTDAINDGRAARDTRSTEWQAIVTGIERLSSYLGVRVSPGTMEPREIGYVPEQARWLDQERTVSPNAARLFNDPPLYSELRYRGASMYCAAKQAHANGGGGTKIMGRKSLVNLSILGQNISLLTLEPTVALAAPKRSSLSTTNDGAQAFTIPLSVGARFAPVSLLPTLPEVRTPVAYVLGDSEVITQSNVSSNLTRWWQTTTHSDLFVASRREGIIDPAAITLFYIGPVKVSLDMHFNLHTEACSFASGANKLATCKDSPHQLVPRLYDSHLGGFPARRTGGFTGMIGDTLYNDNFWTLVGADAHVGGNSGDVIYGAFTGNSLAHRIQSDNDKSVEVRTGLGTTLALQAGANESLGGVLEVDVNVVGSLAGNADVVHTIRDQTIATERTLNPDDEFPARGWRAETSLSVTPHTEASLSGNFFAEAFFIVDLPVLGRQRIGGKLFDFPIGVASLQSRAWDEENRLRIGTGTQWAANTLTSHWPAPRGAAEPATFPAFGQSLQSCMTTAQPTGDLSAPCPSIPGEYPSAIRTTAPRAELCIVGANARPDWDDARADDHCRYQIASFVSRGVNKPYGASARTRLVNATSAQELKNALSECARGGLTAAQISAIATVGMCTDQAQGAPIPVQITRDTGDGADMTQNVCR
jgi:hypothetical protein